MCYDKSSALQWIDAWGRYNGGLDCVLQAFKFSRHHFLAPFLSELLLETWAARGDFEFDFVVPVPMHRSKKRMRGFNQADLLARFFADASGIPYRAKLLSKRREGAPQASLPKETRAANVREAFEASTACESKSVLLIDDICTTGATAEACATELNRRGAARVCALVVARA